MQTNNDRLQMKLFPDMPPEDISKTVDSKNLSVYQKWKLDNNYRKAEKGINCAKCKHILKDTGHATYYYKCKLLGLSHSSATDIRISYVCDRWEQ